MLSRDVSAEATAIQTYAHGMDTKDFGMAVSVLADRSYIDYSAVGGPKGEMSRTEVEAFLTQLLGKQELSIHTAIEQVFRTPAFGDAALAYYSVRHFRRMEDVTKIFSLFGWYEFTLGAGGIDRLIIHVQGTEGDPALLQ